MHLGIARAPTRLLPMKATCHSHSIYDAETDKEFEAGDDIGIHQPEKVYAVNEWRHLLH